MLYVVKSSHFLYFAVMFAFEQCLLVLGHHPDIWYEAAQYLEQSSKLLAEKGVGLHISLKKTLFFSLVVFSCLGVVINMHFSMISLSFMIASFRT